MEIKILVLKNDKYIISEIVERDEEPACLLVNPKEIELDWFYNYSEHQEVDIEEKIQNRNRVLYETNIDKWTTTNDDGQTVDKSRTVRKYAELKNFPPYTHQKQVLLNSFDILTIVDPDPEILSLYRKVVG